MHLDPTTPVLNSLMEAAHTEHLAIISAGKDSVARAMNAGDRLLEIIERKLIHRGQRRTLFKQVCGSTRTGEIYVQLAKARALIEGNAQSSALFSIDAALKFLRQHNGTTRASGMKEKPAISVKDFRAMSPAERSKLLDDIGRELLCASMSSALAADIAEHVLGQHGQLKGGRAASAGRKLVKALGEPRADNVIPLPTRH